MLVADQQGLTLHHHLHLAEVVAHKRRTRGHDIEDSIGQSNARADLYRTRNHVNLSLDAMLVKKLLEDGGIACGNLLAVEPLNTFIVDLLGNSQRQAALRESETGDDFSILAALHELVLTHHANVSHT